MQRNAVRWGLLALFSDGPKYGYQLRTEFDVRTGGTWALNVGQIYATLDRLHRDGLVEAVGENSSGRTVYAITAQGKAELAQWFEAPVPPAERQRSELAIKLIIAVSTPQVDVAAIIQRQRAASMELIRDYTRLRRNADKTTDMAWLLMLDHMVFSVESDMRWLDHVEASVLRDGRKQRLVTTTSQPANEEVSVDQREAATTGTEVA
ncbi:PadR family transcriptional regulator [Actinoplanes sp. NPDC051859]|uniref:PadR family transcriptional regulator n=1 Tax=Actinoplanes sp. NPDC051859 TaxID=3363909 RepID=UPI0037B9022F